MTSTSPLPGSAAERDRRAGAAIFRGIGQQVADDLLDIGRVGDDRRQAGRDVESERHARPALLLRLRRPRQQPLEEDRLPADVAGVLTEPIERDDVLDEPLQALGLLVDVAEDAALRLLVERRMLASEQLRPAEDGRHRRPELVRQDPDEGLADGFPAAGLGDVAQDHDRLLADGREADADGDRVGRDLDPAIGIVAGRQHDRAAGHPERRGRAGRIVQLGEDVARRSASSTSGKICSPAGLDNVIVPSAAQTTTASPIARMTALSSAARACSAWASRWRRTWTSIRSPMSRAIATSAEPPLADAIGWMTISTVVDRPSGRWMSTIARRDVLRPGDDRRDDRAEPRGLGAGEDALDAVSDELVRRPAGDVAGAPVDVADEPGCRIEDDHGLDHGVEDGAREIAGCDDRRTGAIDRTVARRGAGARGGDGIRHGISIISTRTIGRSRGRTAAAHSRARQPTSLLRSNDA